MWTTSDFGFVLLPLYMAYARCVTFLDVSIEKNANR